MPSVGAGKRDSIFMGKKMNPSVEVYPGVSNKVGDASVGGL
jgi:hypothetical protein